MSPYAVPGNSAKTNLFLREPQTEGNVMSKAQKLISGIFALVFALAIAPTASFAATNYDLSVNGEHFTSEKLTIQCGEGTATYDPDAQNLTLNNASITNAVDYGGIDSELTSDLAITLQGSNQITFSDNIGIMATGNVIFRGSGSLAISVAGDTMDGISAAGDVTMQNTAVSIHSPGGLGIACDGAVSLNNTQLTSNGLYAGIDAADLVIKNGCTVNISATEQNCNAAYINSTDSSAGNINISNSAVTAKSLYPGLFATGNMAIDGGTLQATSTVDSPLWAKGNIAIRGKAKVTLSGEYPSGCNGNFTVYEAEIDAKNTSQNNIPALVDCLTIDDDFALTYAMAVDSEGTSIDLIEHDGAEQAKGFLHLYKNIHFITGEKTVTYSLPFTKVVKKGGDIAPGKQEFELEIFDVGVGQIEDYSDVTITATVATNGEGEYESALTIQSPKKQVDNITCEGFCVREKNTGIANWTYSDAVYQIFCNDGATDNQGTAQPSFEVFPVELVATDNGEFFEKTQDSPVDVMTFENVYTEKTAPAEDTKPTEGSDPNASNKSDAGDKPAAATPHTGDGNAPIVAIAALLIAASALFASALRMKKR